MIIAFDSSALVKLLVDERDTDVAQELWNRASDRVASALAYPETMAALAAAGRDKRISRGESQKAMEEFISLWERVDSVEVSDEVAQLAGEFACSSPPIGGSDAVHLATAVRIGATGAAIATWDRRLAGSAREAGLFVVP